METFIEMNKNTIEANEVYMKINQSNGRTN